MLPDLSGQPSPIFGEKYAYPFDGKTVLWQILSEFKDEFNDKAREYLETQHGTDRAALWRELDLTSAYPTTKQACPRIAILRLGSTPKPSGLGMEWDEQSIQKEEGGAIQVRRLAGQVVTDTLEVAICTLNERLRDDLHIWVQQYVLDAAIYALPQLRKVGFYDLACTNAVDDQVEYQGNQSQPGFEFYVSRLTYTAQYDLTILRDIDTITNLFNWELLDPGAGWRGVAGEYEASEVPDPPDSAFFDSTATE